MTNDMEPSSSSLHSGNDQRRGNIIPLDSRDSDTIPSSQWRTRITQPLRARSTSRATVTTSPGAFIETADKRLPATTPSRYSEKIDVITSTSTVCRGKLAVPASKPLRKPAAPSSTPFASSEEPKNPPLIAERTHELLLAKEEARRRRRNLKQSGDFLGVTGVNPFTGEMDVITPTSSSEIAASASSPAESGLAQLENVIQKVHQEYELARRDSRLKHELRKHDKIERDKDAIRMAQQEVKWHRGEHQ